MSFLQHNHTCTCTICLFPKCCQSLFSALCMVLAQRDSRGRCTSHLLCIPLLIPLMSATRAPLEKTLPNFPNQWKSLKAWQPVQSMPSVYLRPQMLLHYSGSSSESTSILFEFVSPARGHNRGEDAQLNSSYVLYGTIYSHSIHKKTWTQMLALCVMLFFSLKEWLYLEKYAN